MKNRDGQRIELSEIDRVDDEGDSFSVRQKGGWSLFISKSECGDFVPAVGDWMLVSYHGFNTIAGIIIEGRVIRSKSTAEIEADHEQWKKNLRLERLERYVTHGEALKERVKNLHPVLQARMARFAAEGGVDFWIESAGYEMACLEGAQALLNKVADLGISDNAAVKWINDWWDINSAKHDPPYDYKKQMEIVPDFGDGHSGNTAGAAKALAIFILEGREV